MAGTYSRVTVVADARRVDVALPRATPVADMLPQLLTLCAPELQRTGPMSWSLSRLGAEPLPAGSSLDQVGVLDGEVLELRAAGADVRPPFVEDIRDAVEDAINETGRMWTSTTTLRFSLLVAGVVLGLLALLEDVRRVGSPLAIVGAGLLGALLLAAGGWAGRRRLKGPAWLLLGVGCGWVGLAGWLIAAGSGWDTPQRGAAGLVAALVAAGLARVVIPLITPHLAALAILSGACTALAAAISLGARFPDVVPVVAVLVVLVIGALPGASIAIGGLASADYRVRNAGTISQAELTLRMRHSMALLTGAVYGAAFTALFLSIVLASSPSNWDRWLGVAIAGALLLRSRIFSYIPHITALRLASITALAAHGYRLYQDYAEAHGLIIMTIVLVTITVGLVSVIPLSDVGRARVKQTLNVTEQAVVIALFPLAAGALGLFDVIVDAS